MNTVKDNNMNPKNAANFMFHKVSAGLDEQGKTTKVYNFNNNFKVVSIESWVKDNSRTQKGSKIYQGLIYKLNSGESQSITIREVSGVKSAYNKMVELLKIEVKDDL